MGVYAAFNYNLGLDILYAMVTVFVFWSYHIWRTCDLLMIVPDSYQTILIISRKTLKKTLKNCLIGECGQISWFGFTRGQQYLSESTSINQPSHRHYWHTSPHSPLVQGSSDVVHLAQHIFQHLLHPRLRAWSVWVEQNLRFPSSWESRLLLLMGSITWSGRQSAWLCVG